MLNIAWTSDYCHPLPVGHRFPMIKYELIPEQLLYEGTIGRGNLFGPLPVQDDDVLAVHTPEYWEKLRHCRLTRQEERRTGFPLSPQLIRRECIIAQGTIDCSYYALRHGISMNVAGGTHHAYADRGEGFCLLNDIAIAARHMIRHRKASQVLVVDLDVHQGNGTAAIFQDDPHVFTFSMHGEKNYPMHKEQSDLDIPLADGTRDQKYLSLLKTGLPRIFEKVHPDLVYFQSGVDILSGDKLGRLDVSLDGCRERDRFVLDFFRQLRIPVVVVMGGGYSPEIRTILQAHANTFRIAQELFF